MRECKETRKAFNIVRACLSLLTSAGMPALLSTLKSVDCVCAVCVCLSVLCRCVRVCASKDNDCVRACVQRERESVPHLAHVGHAHHTHLRAVRRE